MNRLRYFLIAGIITLFPCQQGLITAEVINNRLYDFDAVKKGSTFLYTFKLVKKPFYSLGVSEKNRIYLLFKDTERNEGLDTLLEDNPFIHPDNSADNTKTGFFLTTANNHGRITCGCINEKSTFLVNIESADKGENSGNADTVTVIKDIRFGFKEDAARVAIGTLARPKWRIEYSESNSLILYINGSSENIKTKNYSSDKWLKSVSVSEMGDKTTALRLNLNSAPDQTGISWLSVGNRFVFDMSERPEQMLLDLSSVKNTDIKMAHATDLTINNEKKGDSNIVRMKIDKKELLKSINNPPLEKEEGEDKESNKGKISAQDIAADIKPILKNPLNESAEIPVDVDKLSPEEAFMLGRISRQRKLRITELALHLPPSFLINFRNLRCVKLSHSGAAIFILISGKRVRKTLAIR
jgi:hypothetical protein